MRIDFCNGDFTVARDPATLKFTRPPLSQGYATPMPVIRRGKDTALFLRARPRIRVRYVID